jgi:uncharacterized protein (TIGR00730 family)
MTVRLCVFCGAHSGSEPLYRHSATVLGGSLAREGIGLVYGGGKLGLMGAVADAAMGSGGEAIGVIPQALVDHEVAHQGLTELRIVNSMHERKSQMADLSDGFVALPGGLGTLEELFEIWTWSQLGYHRKPVAILNVGGFFDELIQFLDKLVERGFVRPENRAMLIVATDTDELIGKIRNYIPPKPPQWIRASQR